MKPPIIIFILILFVGCSKNDSLALMMEASFTEQFSNACAENPTCIEATELHMGSCFNKQLAVSAIEAAEHGKEEINTKHILEIQKCLATNAGNNYWEGTDMPRFILDQVN